ncbi:hypothetical protein Tco_0652670 [Tanacetum coccineum]|uniref:Uncharacterized protein n=1 Tax=Tanacetum coccineum TaxID=301880 RepID=A0ABQ4WYZ6_9ASTR
MLGTIMIEDQLQEDVNILERSCSLLRIAKKRKILAISSTEQEYVAAASCCAQVLWMQNQLLDYGFNFMNTEIHIDNETTICIVRNPVLHSKTKHIQIRHHFNSRCDLLLLGRREIEWMITFWKKQEDWENRKKISSIKRDDDKECWNMKEVLKMKVR